jgi:hypothetical protein
VTVDAGAWGRCVGPLVPASLASDAGWWGMPLAEFCDVMRFAGWPRPPTQRGDLRGLYVWRWAVVLLDDLWYDRVGAAGEGPVTISAAVAWAFLHGRRKGARALMTMRRLDQLEFQRGVWNV